MSSKNSIGEILYLGYTNHLSRGHGLPVTSIAVDDKFIYTGSNDKTIKIWTRDDFKEILTLNHHDSRILKLHVTKNLLFTLSEDGVLAKWDMNSLKLKSTSRISKVKLNSACFRNDELCMSNEDGVFKIIDLNNLDEKFKSRLLQGSILSSCFDDKFVYISSDENLVLIYDRGDESKSVQQIDLDSPVTRIDCDDKNVYLLTKQAVFVFRKNDFSKVAMLKSPNHEFVSFAQDDVFLYVWGNKLMGSSELLVWNKDDFTLFKNISGSLSMAAMMGIDEEHVFCWTQDNTLLAWSKQDFEHALMSKPIAKSLKSFLVNEEEIYGAINDKTITVFDKETLELLQTLVELKDPVNLMRVNGSTIYIATTTGKIMILNKKSGNNLDEIKAHDGIITDLSLDDERLYTVSTDKMLKIWNKKNLKNILEKILDAPLKLVGVTTDHVITVDKKNTVKIWNKKTLEEIKSFENLPMIKRLMIINKTAHVVFENSVKKIEKREEIKMVEIAEKIYNSDAWIAIKNNCETTKKKMGCELEFWNYSECGVISWGINLMELKKISMNEAVEPDVMKILEKIKKKWINFKEKFESGKQGIWLYYPSYSITIPPGIFNKLDITSIKEEVARTIFEIDDIFERLSEKQK